MEDAFATDLNIREAPHMRRTIVALGLSLLAVPALAQQSSPSVGQMLQGLTTGNQGQDQALRDAFERGYRAGRQDEARNVNRSSSRNDYRSSDNDYRSSDNQPYQRGPSDR
jgi:hypothetical protein